MKGTGGRQVSGGKFTYFELNREAGVPCDSLCISGPAAELEEAYEMELWLGEEKLFSGPVDSQSTAYDSGGLKSTVWARSAAAFLVDNECMPCSYHMPTADTLFFHFAEEYGLMNCLPPILLEHTYDVQKGTSRWSAIETMVKSVTGSQIFVDCEKRMRLLLPSKQQITVTDKGGQGKSRRFIKAVLKRKRGTPVTKVVYKKETADTYNRQVVNTALAGKGMDRVRCLNLAALPPWRRDKAAAQLIENSLKGYFSIEVTLPGLQKADLYDRVVFDSQALGHFDGLLVTAVGLRSDSKGERTVLTLTPEYGNSAEFFVI